MTGFDVHNSAGAASSDDTSHEFYHHSSAQRVSTDTVIVAALRRQYPDLQLTVSPAFSSNLLAYAAAGFASAEPIEDPNDPLSLALKWRQYVPPARRLGGGGALYNSVRFGKYMYKYKDSEFMLYIVNGRDGMAAYPTVVNNYILGTKQHLVDELLMAASQWAVELHDEVWVFDGGYWQKSRALWESVQNSEWKNVILPKEMKQAIIDDVEDFFQSRDVYRKLMVPWKRGIIYYGPPGNGKTISIKAMMHSLYRKDDPVPTLYVRSLSSYGGPEYSINLIFAKARSQAPCYLVFEDLDSLVTDDVRSYFLNEVDGLKDNDGILMVGSTNHLDRLDDGIAKRPSRFDRKYQFPNPNLEERTAYAKFWQGKLSSNPEIKFPDELCPAVAKITNKFSFAYMQEAFVAALLAIARKGGLKTETTSRRPDYTFSGGKDIDDLPLWKELERQIAILREGIEDLKEGKESTTLEKRTTPASRPDVLALPSRNEDSLYEAMMAQSAQQLQHLEFPFGSDI